MVATLLEPTAGAVLIGGRDVSSLSEREASHFRLSELGFIRQNFDLLPGVSAIDNAILKLLKTMRWREAQREITPLLERLGPGRAPAPSRRDALDGRAPARDDRASALDRSRACCSRTSRPAASTPSAGAKCSSCCGSCAASAAWRWCSSATTRWRPTTPTACSRCATAGSRDYETDTSLRRGSRQRRPAVKPANALRLYRVRLRARCVQECLAIVGIAAGVALLFASQVSSSSLQSSVAQLWRGIAGRATLQLVARGPEGFPASTLGRVRADPRRAGRGAAAGSRRERDRPAGKRVGRARRRRREPVERLGGTLVRHTALTPFGGIGAVVLPAPLAQTIGVRKFGQEVTFQLAGHTVQAPLYAAAPRTADRRADREPGRDRAAVLRPGNDRPAGAREPHPRAAGARRGSPRARGAVRRWPRDA